MPSATPSAFTASKQNCGHVVTLDYIEVAPHDVVTTPTRRGKLLDLALIIIVVTLIILIEAGYLPQRHLGFICGDPTLSYPFRGDSVSTTAMMVISYAFPLVYIVVMEFARGTRGKPLLWVTLKWYREFLIGINIALVLCQMSKVLTGELRPHFFDTCAPDVLDTCKPGEYVTDYVCTSTFPRKLIKDSFRSFPSGHTAVSTYAAVFAAYYIHYRYNLREWGNWLKPMLLTFTLLWSPFTSFSRLIDNRHHWWDVFAGFGIGIFASVYTAYYLCRTFDCGQQERRSNPAAAALLDCNRDNNGNIEIR